MKQKIEITKEEFDSIIKEYENSDKNNREIYDLFFIVSHTNYANEIVDYLINSTKELTELYHYCLYEKGLDEIENRILNILLVRNLSNETYIKILEKTKDEQVLNKILLNNPSKEDLIIILKLNVEGFQLDEKYIDFILNSNPTSMDLIDVYYYSKYFEKAIRILLDNHINNFYVKNRLWDFLYKTNLYKNEILSIIINMIIH